MAWGGSLQNRNLPILILVSQVRGNDGLLLSAELCSFALGYRNLCAKQCNIVAEATSIALECY